MQTLKDLLRVLSKARQAESEATLACRRAEMAAAQVLNENPPVNVLIQHAHPVAGGEFEVFKEEQGSYKYLFRYYEAHLWDWLLHEGEWRFLGDIAGPREIWCRAFLADV